MYAFANSARDLTRAYYNPDINFEFSKFALLDLPVYADAGVGNNDQSTGPNYINYTNLFEGGGGENASAYSDTAHDGNGNVHFAQTFQSYALNLENMLLNPEVNDDFDDVLFQSDAEKIFFKYLYHINAIRVRTATSQEVSTGYSRMIELDDSTQSGSEYSQVIKYIGNIDVTNDKNYKGQQYNEIFVNVPSSVGYTPEVLLETSKFNTNNIKFNPSLDGMIEGRTPDDIHPDPFLRLESYADQSDGTYNTDENEIPTFGIDFNASAYSKIINDPKLDSVLDYSRRGGDFRFNAILVYYDIYSKSNIGNKATNLYGIILLDNWKEDTSNDGWYIPELTKYKPNEVTGLNGNAFALKLNLKFNSALDNVGIEKNINDYSTFSMDIFLDTTSALENAVQLLKDANKRYNSISKKVEMLESFFLSSESLQGISKRLDNIEQDVENATLNFQDERSLLDLITNTNSRLNQVISGVIPAEIQYNTDVLESGNTGVSIDKSSNGKVKISCVNYGYSLGQPYVYDTVTSTNERELSADSMFLPDEAGTKAVWQRLKEFDNLVRIYTDQTQSFDSNLNIYLDDTITSWKKGQVVRVTFKNKIKNLSTHYITLWTDKSNGWSQKLSISLSDLLSNKPYIEIVCVDPVNKTFEYDILR